MGSKIGKRFPLSGISADGRPYSCGCIGLNGPEGRDNDLLDRLSPLEQKVALLWVRERLSPRKTVNDRRTSYGLKHYLEYETGVYMTNNMFKDLLLREGYKPSNEHELNWKYAISEKSPALRREARLHTAEGQWLIEHYPELSRRLFEEYTDRRAHLTG